MVIERGGCRLWLRRARLELVVSVGLCWKGWENWSGMERKMRNRCVIDDGWMGLLLPASSGASASRPGRVGRLQLQGFLPRHRIIFDWVVAVR